MTNAICVIFVIAVIIIIVVAIVFVIVVVIVVVWLLLLLLLLFCSCCEVECLLLVMRLGKCCYSHFLEFEPIQMFAAIVASAKGSSSSSSAQIPLV